MDPDKATLEDIYSARGALVLAIAEVERISLTFGPSKTRNILDDAQCQMEEASEALWKAATYQERLLLRRGVSVAPSRHYVIHPEIVNEQENGA